VSINRYLTINCRIGIRAEHEITGDVLLELDVGILKEELNITAFGKRMRIANAILELRRPASFSSDPAVFHNGFTGVSTPGAVETNGHRQEALSIVSGDAQGQRLSPAVASQASVSF
jgi:SAM domain (Sterile alpha motif)